MCRRCIRSRCSTARPASPDALVGLVIVSHSAALADGVVALAREMGGEEVGIAAAGGMDDGSIGTDAARVLTAVEEVRSPDGVLVLMDLGSALMSAEMATEMADPDGGPVLLCAAPLVEGAVAAAARARGGATLDEVAREARGALRMKTAQLGEEDEGEAEAAPAGVDAGAAHELRVTVEPKLGLHARPAARFVGALAELDARVEVSNATRSTGPADGRSLTGLAVLGVKQGDEILVRASGPQAEQAIAALRALAEDNFGDPREDGAAAAPAPEAPAAGAGRRTRRRRRPGPSCRAWPRRPASPSGPRGTCARPTCRSRTRPRGRPRRSASGSSARAPPRAPTSPPPAPR